MEELQLKNSLRRCESKTVSTVTQGLKNLDCSSENWL